MTAHTVDRPAIGAGSRILNIARLHTANLQTYFGIPWIITGFAFAVTLVIALIIRSVTEGAATADGLEGMRYSWAMVSPVWYLVVVGVMAVASTFSFALGLSATRRDFILGTVLTFAGMSLVNAIGFAVLYLVEVATDGFGIGLHFFTSMWLDGSEGVGVAFFTYVVVFFTVLALGAVFASIWMRWKSLGVTLAFIGVAVVVLGIGAIIVLTRSTAAFFAWVVGVSLVQWFLLLLALAVVALAVTWIVLRRAPARV